MIHISIPRTIEKAEARQFAVRALSVRPRSLTATEEALADQAFLALFRLRESLVLNDANHDACRVDDLISTFQSFCKARVP